MLGISRKLPKQTYKARAESTRQQSPVLKQVYITPDDVVLPENQAPEHSNIPVKSWNTSDQRKRELDGFFLLECTGKGFPEDAVQAILTDKSLTSVVADDFTFFTSIFYVDVSENNLNLEPFGAFPALVELRLACNGISYIGELQGFINLMYLDLSYNKLTFESVQPLEYFPNLKELDLSGNNLRLLPQNMHRFRSLEKIMLEYNKIEDTTVFNILSSISTIRQVGLANNFLSNVPEQCVQHGGFRYVRHACFASSSDLLFPLDYSKFWIYLSTISELRMTWTLLSVCLGW